MQSPSDTYPVSTEAVRQIPLARLGTADDVARVVAFSYPRTPPTRGKRPLWRACHSAGSAFAKHEGFRLRSRHA